MSRSEDPRVADVLRAGVLRTALFLPQFQRDGSTGELRGLGTGHIGIEVTKALAATVGVRPEIVGHDEPGHAVAALQSGACDMAFLGIEASRAAVLDFTPPIFEFDFAYLVPPGSALSAAGEVDRSGNRIAVTLGHASTLALGKVVHHAALIGAEVPEAAFELLRSGEADAFAFPRDVLMAFSSRLPGSVVLGDAYGINRVGIAIRKGRPDRLAYLAEALRKAKANGDIDRAIEQGRLHGFRVVRD